jgi:hypothetical protein
MAPTTSYGSPERPSVIHFGRDVLARFRRRQSSRFATQCGQSSSGGLVVQALMLVVVWTVISLGAAGCFEELNPGISEETAKLVVAQGLCPEDPEKAIHELFASLDTLDWIVYVRASNEINGPEDIEDSARDTKASFRAHKFKNGEPGFDPRGERDEAYLVEARAACARGEPLP